MRIRYNSPVILSFALLAAGALVLNRLSGGAALGYFVSVPGFGWGLLDFVRLFSHVLGHRDWLHLVSNFSFILLIGPVLEEKHGSGALLGMILVTALVTGVLNVLFFSTGLMGSSGIVFMLILLSSFTNIRAGEIPLTFILVVVLFLAREVISAFGQDNVSQFAHVIGGLCGSLFGFLVTRPAARRPDPRLGPPS